MPMSSRSPPPARTPNRSFEPILLSLCAAADAALRAVLAHVGPASVDGGGDAALALAHTLALCDELATLAPPPAHDTLAAAADLGAEVSGKAAEVASTDVARPHKRARTAVPTDTPAARTLHLLDMPRSLLVDMGVRFCGATDLARLDAVCSFFPKTGFCEEVVRRLRPLLPSLRRPGWAQLL